MLQLLDWQQQIVCSMLDSLGDGLTPENSGARPTAKGKVRRKR